VNQQPTLSTGSGKGYLLNFCPLLLIKAANDLGRRQIINNKTRFSEKALLYKSSLKIVLGRRGEKPGLLFRKLVSGSESLEKK